jgi:ParB family chromosome partitioning protein
MSMNDETRVIKIENIVADTNFNCRGEFTEYSIQNLARAIEKDGLLQSPVVKQLEDGKYKLIAGFRRMAAIKFLKWTEVKCTVIDRTDKECMIINLSENIDRQDLTTTQEARGIVNLYKSGMTEYEIAHKLNRAFGWVKVRLAIDKLSPNLKELVDSKELKGELILEAANIPDFYEQEKFVKTALFSKKQSRIIKQFSDSRKPRKPNEMNIIAAHVDEVLGPNPISMISRFYSGQLSHVEALAQLRAYYNELGIKFDFPIEIK